MSASDLSRRPSHVPPDRHYTTGAAGSATPSLLRVVNAVLRGRTLIAATALLVAAAVVAVTLVRPRTYSASASFLPQGRGSSGTGISGLAAQFGVSLQNGGDTQSPQFYVDLLSSREILRGVVDHQYEVRTDTGLVRGNLADFFRVFDPDPALRREETMDRLRGRLNAAVTPKTGVVTVSVVTPWAPLSHQIAERLVILLNEFNLHTRQSQAAAERRFTEQRLAEVRAELRAAENRLESFLEANRGTLRNSPQLQFEYDRLTRDVQLRNQVYLTLVQAFEQAKIDEVRDTPVITLVEHPELPVRPNRRYLLLKGGFGFALGLLTGLVVVLVKHIVPRSDEHNSDEAAEFAALRRETVGDLTHPWRPITRLLRGRRAASF